MKQSSLALLFAIISVALFTGSLSVGPRDFEILFRSLLFSSLASLFVALVLASTSSDQDPEKAKAAKLICLLQLNAMILGYVGYSLM